MAWYHLYKEKTTAVLEKEENIVAECEVKPEPNVYIKTGKIKNWIAGYPNTFDISDEPRGTKNLWHRYTPEILEVPLAEAVQMLIDYLGLQVEYSPAREESKGPLFKPKKGKKK